MGVQDQLNTSQAWHSKGTGRPITVEPPADHLMSSKKFSGVHGPLLSSPIVPKVRRAIESNVGLRRFVPKVRRALESNVVCFISLCVSHTSVCVCLHWIQFNQI